MLQVSLLFELLRSQPRALFWLVTLAQAVLWWLLPSLFYAAPPGDLPLVLAVGHEFQLGTYLGPPLAPWLGELAFDLGGMPTVYLLSQLCIVVTYWAVFTLGTAIVGASHAAIAIMLMVGIVVFNVATPEFGPALLATPISAMMLLHFWRAIGENKRRYWLGVALDTGLLLLTTYAGLLLCAAMVLFTAATERGRAQLRSIDPWIAGIVVVVLMFPHLIWLDAAGDVLGPALQRLLSVEAANANFGDAVRLALRVAFLHGGLIVLAALAAGWRLKERERVPVFRRRPVDPFARRFVYYFAIVPLLLASIVAVVAGERSPIGGTAPLVVLSALAVVVAAGDAIELHRQRLVGRIWGVLLMLPPIATLAAISLMPWIAGSDLSVTQPATAIGRFFSDSFQRRTGRPLEIVAGDARLASLIALYAEPRASLYVDANPTHSPWISADDVRRKGALVVWIATDTVGTPPAEVKARFPDLVPDVPRVFERAVQGRTPLLRIGWGLVRPQAAAPLPPAR